MQTFSNHESRYRHEGDCLKNDKGPFKCSYPDCDFESPKTSKHVKKYINTPILKSIHNGMADFRSKIIFQVEDHVKDVHLRMGEKLCKCREIFPRKSLFLKIIPKLIDL